MLREEFDHDHLVVARGLARLHRALKAEDWPAVRAASGELDAAAGAHIRFEQDVVYPRLTGSLGVDGVDRLLAQHRQGADLLARIATADDLEMLRSHLLEEVRLAVEHLTACGSLFHAVAAELSEDPENALRMNADRERDLRWTEVCR